MVGVWWFVGQCVGDCVCGNLFGMCECVDCVWYFYDVLCGIVVVLLGRCVVVVF